MRPALNDAAAPVHRAVAAGGVGDGETGDTQEPHPWSGSAGICPGGTVSVPGDAVLGFLFKELIWYPAKACLFGLLSLGLTGTAIVAHSR